MKVFLKKNQIIIYVIAFMLVVAGYLNYTTKNNETSLQTSMQMESSDDTKIADIGDATLVSSNDIAASDSINAIDDGNVTSNTSVETNNVNEENTTSNNAENTVETNSSNNSNNSDYFVKSKLERDTMYSQMIETYEKILNSSNSLETQKQSATEEITKINNVKNSIMICENLIQTKGFENSIIFVNGSSVSVIIEAQQLEKDQIAQIQNIISREMNANIENIHITTK